MTTFLKFGAVSIFFILSMASFAGSFEIKLTDLDQSNLTSDLSKIDVRYITSEVVQEAPYSIVKKTYSYLDDSHPFYIQCSEKFINFSTVGTEKKCVVSFNYELSQSGVIEAHDGFIPEAAVTQIKDSEMARMLYKTIGNGVTPTVFFSSSEMVKLTHPSTGKSFPAFRLRIDCKRDSGYKEFSCVVGAIK